MEKITFRHIMLWGIVICLALLTGCRSMKEKALTYAHNNPKDFAEFCGDKYPPKDSIADPIRIYIPADNKNYKDQINKLYDVVDSLQVANHQDKSDVAKQYQGTIDLLAKETKRLKDAYKPCEPDTLKITEKHYITNTAQVVHLTEKVDTLKKDLQQSKDGNTRKTYWIIGLGLVIVVLIVTRKYG